MMGKKKMVSEEEIREACGEGCGRKAKYQISASGDGKDILTFCEKCKKNVRNYTSTAVGSRGKQLFIKNLKLI